MVALSMSCSAPATISEDEAVPELIITIIGISVSTGSVTVLNSLNVPGELPFCVITSDPLGTNNEVTLTASSLRPPPLPLRSRTSRFIP